jgi:hypothetical protein
MLAGMVGGRPLRLHLHGLLDEPGVGMVSQARGQDR